MYDTYKIIFVLIQQAEDDGVVLVHTLIGGTEERNKVVMVVLNASDMSEIASVETTLPSDAPRALHAVFIPST